MFASILPSSTWPMFQFEPGHNAVFDQPQWDVSWKTDIGGRSNGGLSIVGSTVYVESLDHTVYALDAQTGKMLWSKTLPGQTMNTPLILDHTLIAGTGQAALLADYDDKWLVGRAVGDAVYGLDTANGNVLWKFATVGEDMPTGVITASTRSREFVFSNGDDHVYALDPRSGECLWKNETVGENAMGSLVEDNGRVFGMSTLSTRTFIDLELARKSQARLWDWTWALEPEGGQYEWTAPYGLSDSSATVGGGIVFVQGLRLASPLGEQGSALVRRLGWASFADGVAQWSLDVTALDEFTGRMLWHYLSAPGPDEVLGSATISADALYAAGVVYEPLPVAHQLAAFVARTGQMLWNIRTEGPAKTSPVLKDGLLYLGDASGRMYVIDAEHGRIEHEIAFPGMFSKSPPVIVGSTMYVVNGHWLYALRLSDLVKSGDLGTETLWSRVRASADGGQRRGYRL